MPRVAESPSTIPAAEVKFREAVVIGRAGDCDLTGDLFLPPLSDTPRPGLVILHGGGWRKGAPRGVRGFGELLSRAGFVCLAPGYRLSGEARWPAQIEDVKCAIRYLRAECRTLGVDPERIGATGDSAGGHLALMAAVAYGFEGRGGHQTCASNIKAVGAMYGPVRVTRERADGQPVDLLSAQATAEDYERASPIAYDLSRFPPCILIHGAEDPAVPLAGTTELYQKLSGLGRTVELHVFAGAGHAFDRRSPHQERMVDVADPTSTYGVTVVRLITHFFQKYL